MVLQWILNGKKEIWNLYETWLRAIWMICRSTNIHAVRGKSKIWKQNGKKQPYMSVWLSTISFLDLVATVWVLSYSAYLLYFVLFKIMWLNVGICSDYWVVESSSLSAVLQRWILKKKKFYFSIGRIKQLNDMIGKISTTIRDTQTSESWVQEEAG